MRARERGSEFVLQSENQLISGTHADSWRLDASRCDVAQDWETLYIDPAAQRQFHAEKAVAAAQLGRLGDQIARSRPRAYKRVCLC